MTQMRIRNLYNSLRNTDEIRSSEKLLVLVGLKPARAHFNLSKVTRSNREKTIDDLSCGEKAPQMYGNFLRDSREIYGGFASFLIRFL